MYKNYVHLQCEECGREKDFPFIPGLNALTWFYFGELPGLFFCSRPCVEAHIQQRIDQERDEAQSTFNHRQEP